MPIWRISSVTSRRKSQKRLEDTYYYSYEPYQDYEVGESFEEAFETEAAADPGASDYGDELIDEQPPEDDAEEVVFFEDPDLA